MFAHWSLRRARCQPADGRDEDGGDSDQEPEQDEQRPEHSKRASPEASVAIILAHASASRRLEDSETEWPISRRSGRGRTQTRPATRAGRSRRPGAILVRASAETNADRSTRAPPAPRTMRKSRRDGRGLTPALRPASAGAHCLPTSEQPLLAHRATRAYQKWEGLPYFCF